VTAVRGARELFVWYRVAADRAERVGVAVEAMQRLVKAQIPGLEARLLIRDDGSGSQTWMETYALREGAATSSTGIDAAMQASIETAAAPIRPWLEGDRHVEGFEVAGRH
jgi:hypothetical protein